MNSKSKKWTALVLALGLLVVGGSTAWAYSNGNPYEAFKKAAIETAKQTNKTTLVSVQVTENGNQVVNGDVLMQQAGKNFYSSSNLVINGDVVDMEQAKTDQGVIIREGDSYTAYQMDRENRGRDQQNEELTPNVQKLLEMVTDTLVGDVKNHFTAQGDTVTVHLDSTQVPELANVALAAMTEIHAQAGQEDPHNFMTIKNNPAIKSLDVQATVTGGVITVSDVQLVLTGNDAAGQFVETEISAQSAISDIGSTVVKTIDTTGKNVTAGELKRMHR